MSKHIKTQLSSKERSIVCNLFSFFKGLKSDLKVGLKPSRVKLESHTTFRKYKNIYGQISSIMGVSESTIQRIVKPTAAATTIDSNNYHDNNPQPGFKKRGRKSFICHDIHISYIKNTVLNFYINQEYPKVRTIWQKCLENPNFPRISKETFRLWMIKKCHLKFRKSNKKPVFLERPDIVLQRELYLNKALEYRSQGYYFIFTDETWADIAQSPNRYWQLCMDLHEIQDYKEITAGKVFQDMEGHTGGFKVKGGAGRIIINHAGGKDGWVANAEDIFRSKNGSQDYHTSMNQPHWTQWFIKLLENAPDHSVIIVDRAPYHRERVKDTVMAKKSWRKQAIIDNLITRGVPVPEGMSDFHKLTIPSLIALSEQHPVQVKYVIEDLVEKCQKDIKILWLPVAHCELNPIEIVWSWVKRYISEHNKGGADAERVTLEAVSKVTPDLWSKCCDRAIKFENAMRRRDGLVEKLFYNNNEGTLGEEMQDDELATQISDSHSDTDSGSPLDTDSDSDLDFDSDST